MNNSSDVLSATLQDSFETPTWNTPRSIAQLREFITRHDEALDIEDFFDV